jgi:hypothetical protein
VTLRVVVDRKGNLRVRGLPALCADPLLQVPDLLRSEDPAVRARLAPEPYADAADRDEWRRYAQPEIARLFESRVEIVTRDLATLRADGKVDFQLAIPKGHRTAWLSALNAARLALFITAGLEAEDMAAEPGELEDVEHDVAVWRVHLLAFLQELLLEAGGYRDEVE